jgi:hypothetical protein
VNLKFIKVSIYPLLDPALLPVDELQIEGLCMNNIVLVESICTKKQLDEFATLQVSPGTRRVYFKENAELAYI